MYKTVTVIDKDFFAHAQWDVFSKDKCFPGTLPTMVLMQTKYEYIIFRLM